MAEKNVLPQQSDVVRIVRTLNGRRDAFFGIVIAVAQALPENLGTQNEPTITAAALDPLNTNTAQLGRVDWHQALTRFTGLRHISHSDVQAGKESMAYIDVVPSGGEEIDLPELNMDDLDEPAIETQDAEDTTGNVVYHDGNNGLDVVHVGENEFTVEYNKDTHRFSDRFSAETFAKAQVPEVGQKMDPLVPKGTELSQSDAASGRIEMDQDKKNDPARLDVAKDKMAERVPVVGPDSVPVSSVDPNTQTKGETTDNDYQIVDNGESRPSGAQQFSVKKNGEHVADFDTHEAAQHYIDGVEVAEQQPA